LTKTIPQKKYCKLLNHLSTIARQGDTYLKTDGSHQQSNSTSVSPQAELDFEELDFLDDLRKASFEDREKMNTWIYDQMLKYCQSYLLSTISQESDNQLSVNGDLPISLCHKYVDDFYDAPDITIIILSQKTLSMPISIVDVLDAFLDDFINTEILVSREELQKIKISFKRKNNRVIEEPLINYIEAEYYDQYSGKHFIRKGNMCYELSANYLEKIQESFMSTLRNIRKSDVYKYHESITRHTDDEKFWPVDFQQLKNEMNEKQKQLFESMNKKKSIQNIGDVEDAHSSAPTDSTSNETVSSGIKPREERETIFNMTYLGMKDHFLGDKVSIIDRLASEKKDLLSCDLVTFIVKIRFQVFFLTCIINYGNI
jgi:hypothetical protein